MAPNACSACRSKKLKCVAQAGQRACVRCSTRDLPCSYEPAIHDDSRPSGAVPGIIPDLPTAGAYPPAAADSSPVYRLRGGYVGLDISRGRPQDVLREGQLAQSLVQLYFIHYSDIHFMLDEETMLRQLALGEVPKILLYSIMALAIRFSHAPFDDDGSTANRGELMFDHARRLLQQDFDRLSITNIQVYILLSTYKLAYGGPAQAHTFLSIAANMIQLLRIMEFDSEIDPIRIELDRRLVATMMIMDHLVSGSLRLPLLISSQYATPTVMNEDEFWALKRRTTSVVNSSAMNPASMAIPDHILRLSRLLHAACTAYWTAGSRDISETLTSLSEEHRLLRESWDASLLCTEENLARHRAKESIRIFLFMHLLDNHVGQVIHFCSLLDPFSWFHHSPSHTTTTTATTSPPSFSFSAAAQAADWQSECHKHAHAVMHIVEYALAADIDLHNFQVGQILVAATVVLTHEILTRLANNEFSPSPLATTTTTITTLRMLGTSDPPPAAALDNVLMAAKIESSPQIRAIRECIVRSRRHTRMYDWVLQQFDVFCQLCSSSTPAAVGAVFAKNTQLLREVLRIGSFYERRDPRTGGRREGIEALFYPDGNSPS
ncbi:uncharacterized protein B0I36DRAFT_36377 [Microdochium trichocladiopsis]|uniref:Zn(2)-C6 fungal-type domain-containing protein n=1 Tax=Microdochium trichocladiopsis TaxID=1682393 RepID=A0A9P8XU51_9PEZI|nr:uncharacterized protein B0I36DRAFT_36377 [Microdochium trichocladiopsis]KAH7018174.1 hypothetical protein B0I36DRAFT_36377 [Microdochium trichocladiopsis]